MITFIRTPRLARYLLTWLLVCAPGVGGQALAEKKVALIIGNTNYHHVPVLHNPRNDAESVARFLEKIGFEREDVTVKLDVSYDDMRKAILAFSRKARGSDTAIIYFSGHGFGSGVNYLIPVDAELKAASDLTAEAISQRSLEDAVGGARGLKLVIIDACRNDPSQGKMTDLPSTRSVFRGLERVEPDAGVLVLYSAKHGTTAQDGPPGGASPFAAALVKHLATPGKEIRFAIGAIRDSVKAATGGEQEPYLYGSLGEAQLFLVAPENRPSTSSQTGPGDGGVRTRLQELEEELKRQKAESEARERRIDEERERDRRAAEARERERERRAAIEREENARLRDAEPATPSGRKSVCGWYAIHYCSKSYDIAAVEARKFAGYVIDTNDPSYPNFAGGWYCSVLGPMDKSGALGAVARAKNRGFPTAYVKNPC